jgi:hypothetical protein
MKRKQSSGILFVSLFMLTLACVIVPAPLDKGRTTQTSITPSPFSFTATVPSPIVTAIPASPPTFTPTVVLQNPVLSPTAQFFPEEQLHTVIDQTGVIEVTIPTTWTDVRTEPWVDEKGETIGTTFTASTAIDAFLRLQAEGVAISVSRRLPIGYVQLLEREYDFYVKSCQDVYKTRWKLDDPVYRGMYFVFGECNGVRDTWLSLFSVVNKSDPGQYIARVVAYDMIPIFGDAFRDIIMKFKVFPENIP